ncbi:YrhB domain-containing protein [Streptomyces sp. NBC_00203]|uniref:YrhB domain-containing protein n=1 Tax=Streptomyces sp. NBC_00203 TaxID=2975680 RepID=UPI00324A63C8
MVTKERAVVLAEALLSRERQAWPWMARLPPVIVLDVEEHALGWLVFWQSVECVRSREIEKMLVGHGPYPVDRQDGGIHHIPVTTYVGEDSSHLPLKKSLVPLD